MIPARALLGRRGFFTDANGCVAKAAWESVPFRPIGYAEDHMLAHDMLRADDAVLHRQEAGQFVSREAEHGDEDLRRERHRELLGEVDLLVIDERVDQPVDQFGDRLLERLHPLWREQRVEDLAVLALRRRVGLERDQRAPGLEVGR